MKKLNHPNLVQLIEVLDDPAEDSLYMVLEMCKKGVVMKVGLDEKADPYDAESCRCWFRDLILGIEYCELLSSIYQPRTGQLMCLQYMRRAWYTGTSSRITFF
jgi:serine/threonine protein kinase